MNMKKNNKRKWLSLALSAGLLVSLQAKAHFGMLIPSDDMVKQTESRKLKIDAMFWHPFEGNGMNLAKPVHMGVMVNGTKKELGDQLQTVTRKDSEGNQRTGYTLDYKLRKPGDHVFYMEPQPYWEPAEESFIVHYTKVIVNAFGLEEGWDQPVGMKAEIMPLTRPYGLYAGNVFQGRVLLNGKPAAATPVEVEYFANGKMHADADPMVTQVVLTDDNGIFTYAMPKSGWWGFAALSQDDKTITHEGKAYPIEIGAVLWVKTHDMK